MLLCNRGWVGIFSPHLSRFCEDHAIRATVFQPFYRCRPQNPLEAGTFHIEVQDDGPGIDVETLGKLLRRTYTTRKAKGGTGLGLLISQHIIEAHQGRIWIESEVGVGTTVHVELPARQDFT